MNYIFLKKLLFNKLILLIVSQPVLSRIGGWVTGLRRPRFVVRLMIRVFKTFYRIDMTEYRGDWQDYDSFKDFFVRPLNSEKRSFKPVPSCLLSPCDGYLSEIQYIDSDKAVQVKGWTYSVSELTGSFAEDWSKGWWLAELYLSPKDYHRYHYPMSGYLSFFHQLGNSLFPVNQMGMKNIAGLFVRNERVVAGFDIRGNYVYMVAVGATFVGGIKMNEYPQGFVPGQKIFINKQIKQLDEMGRFELGSTLIILLPKSLARPLISMGQNIRVGDQLFHF